MDVDLQSRLSALVPGEGPVRWSVSLRDGAGAELAAVHADMVLPTASVGKLLLLLEVARGCEAGTLRADELLARSPDVAVADSGLWQHLSVEQLGIEDLAVLVASVSDNLATNVLLGRVGLSRVQALGAELGLEQTRLLDRVRDRRTPGDPPCLSEGAASELSGLMSSLAAGALVSAGVSATVERWLATGTDLSMVASAFGLDPLAHGEADRAVLLRCKTGTDAGVRADVGFVRGAAAVTAYAAIASWDPDQGDPRDDVLATMRAIGALLVPLVC